MSLSPVSKPASAGEGKTALVKVASTYVNIRTGPGTDYTDIGDLMNSTYVIYYPDSNTNGWVWIEQNGSAGLSSARPGPAKRREAGVCIRESHGTSWRPWGKWGSTSTT